MWDLKRLAAACSMILDKYERFEIGPYEFAASGSRFGLLSKGIVIAYCNFQTATSSDVPLEPVSE